MFLKSLTCLVHAVSAWVEPPCVQAWDREAASGYGSAQACLETAC